MVKIHSLVTPYVCPALLINMVNNQYAQEHCNGRALDKLIHLIQQNSPRVEIEQLLECADDETRDSIDQIFTGKKVINAVQLYRKRIKNVRYCEEIEWGKFRGRPQFLFESYDTYIVFMIKQNSKDHFIHKHISQMQMYMEMLQHLRPHSEIKGQIGLVDIDKVTDIKANPGVLEYAVEQRKTAFKIYHGAEFNRTPSLCAGVCCAYQGRCKYSK
jgi:hypothetical protein